ncbi:hypothetical protein F4774DRAFT_420697 [Daldinia eschscholtzii]|nr:hypothetical protein F4774DRAFT_420697 [Daldinia eschscholtzii]
MRNVGPPVEEYLYLIRFLLDSGLDPNAECSFADGNDRSGLNRGGTILDLFTDYLYDPARHDLARLIHSELDSRGAQFSRPLQGVAKRISYSRIGYFNRKISGLKVFPEQIDLCDLSPLVSAVINRSEKDFTRIIRRCDINYASSVNGLTAMHFAVSWPFALRALIEAGANIECEDHHNRRPIHLAVELQFYEAVEILVKADCALWSPPSLRALHQSALLHPLPVQTRAPVHDGVVHAVTERVIDRHTRLFCLGTTMIPESSLIYQVNEDGLDETLAPSLIEELLLHGIQIPPTLRLDGVSLFDSADFDASIRIPTYVADKFWNSGLRNIAGFDKNGLTPVLHNWYAANFDMVS